MIPLHFRETMSFIERLLALACKEGKLFPLLLSNWPYLYSEF